MLTIPPLLPGGEGRGEVGSPHTSPGTGPDTTTHLTRFAALTTLSPLKGGEGQHPANPPACDLIQVFPVILILSLSKYADDALVLRQAQDEGAVENSAGTCPAMTDVGDAIPVGASFKPARLRLDRTKLIPT